MSLLISVLSSPHKLSKLDQTQWQLLLAQANVCQLVARLNYLMDQLNYSKPDYVKWHLESAYKIAEKQKKQAVVEFLEVPLALNNTSSQLIFLKGAAYIAKNLPCSYGRTFSDIDILVKKNELKKIETRLKFSNWLKSEVDDYDEKYYRTWMHEIPPLYHTQRGTVLDVHHNILPLTNKNTLDSNRFNLSSINIPNVGSIQTLDDIDLCIHMAVHLFTESEFHNGLRDLSDFDMLLQHFQILDKEFVRTMLTRSREIGLYGYTRLAVRYTHMVFSTPINNIKLDEIANDSKVITSFQDFCFYNIFQPNHISCRNWKMKISEFLLYWRGHLLRMPLRLLVPHLIKKSYMRLVDYFKREDDLSQLP